MKIYRHQKKIIPLDVMQEIIAVLAKGGLVVLPTDTSYMLAADATNHNAVDRLYTLKNRSRTQPVSLCFSDIDMAAHHAKFSPLAKRIAEKYLPGPLTLVLPIITSFPEMLVKNNKIGVRIPDVPVTLSVVRAYGKPLTATSANKSDGKEPYQLLTVIEELGTMQIEFVVDAGSLDPKPVSTIAEIGTDSIKILRKGPVTESELHQLI